MLQVNRNHTLVRMARLAELLSVPVVWLRQEADAGRIPCLKAGRTYLFNVGAVEQVLVRRAAEGLPEDSAGAREALHG